MITILQRGNASSVRLLCKEIVLSMRKQNHFLKTSSLCEGKASTEMNSIIKRRASLPKTRSVL